MTLALHDYELYGITKAQGAQKESFSAKVLAMVEVLASCRNFSLAGRQVAYRFDTHMQVTKQDNETNNYDQPA